MDGDEVNLITQVGTIYRQPTLCFGATGTCFGEKGNTESPLFFITITIEIRGPNLRVFARKLVKIKVWIR